MIYRLKRAAAIAALLSVAAVAAAKAADDVGALLTFSLHGAGTVYSSTVNNGINATVQCTLNQSDHDSSNGQSTTFTIQGYDKASNSYYDIITSAAVTADSTPSTIAAGRGVATVSNVSAGMPIPSKWRVKAVIGGTSTPKISGTIGCARNADN